MKNTLSHYDGRTYLIHINSYIQNIPSGKYYNLCGEEKGQFQSMAQLILQLEQNLNEGRDSRQIHKVRTLYPPVGCFVSERHGNAMGEWWIQKGKMATFSIQISFHRNASWQGTILWMEKQITKKFRSVLELMILMDTALTDTVHSRWMELETCVSNS